MLIYIMTRGRVGRQITLANLPKSLLDKTYLVVPKGENHDADLAKYYPLGIIYAPEWVTNYSQKFQWILDGLPYQKGEAAMDGKAVIMDDDLVFSKREGNSLKTIRDPELLVPMFEQMERLLDEFPLVGVHPRQMGQNAPEPYVINGRVICIQGINRKLIGTVKVDELSILADVILNCTLLSRGQPNALITTYFQDHGPCQAPGGCSTYRTPDIQREAAEYIAKRWHPFAKTVIRRPKVAKWMGGERTEFQVQWKKLFKWGVDNATN